MADSRPLRIPVILGTARKGRMSAHVARFVHGELEKREGVVTEMVDVAALPVRLDDSGQDTADPTFSACMNRADAIVLVAPEYNHAMPGLLKHVLDSCLKEYVHKAAGIVAVSAGPFGGTRVIETTLPVLRELGLVTIFWDVNVGSVAKVFDERGTLLDPALVRRTDKFLGELIWMARTLRYGRESIALQHTSAEMRDMAERPMICPRCGAGMNRHSEKLVYTGETRGPGVDPVLGGVMQEMHACPRCGYVDARRAG